MCSAIVIPWAQFCQLKVSTLNFWRTWTTDEWCIYSTFCRLHTKQNSGKKTHIMEAKHIESCFYANRLDHNTHNGDMKMYLHEKKHCLFIHTYGWHGSYSFAFLNATEHQMVMRKHSPIAIQTVNFASEINCLFVLFFSSLHILYGAENEMQSPALKTLAYMLLRLR